MSSSPQLIVVLNTRNLCQATLVPVALLQDTVNLRQSIVQLEGLLQRNQAKDPRATKQQLGWLKMHFFTLALRRFLGETMRAVQRIIMVGLRSAVLNFDISSPFFEIITHHHHHSSSTTTTSPTPPSFCSFASCRGTINAQVVLQMLALGNLAPH